MKLTYSAPLTVLCLGLAAGPLFGAGIEVPDLETRIRNSGGEVPASALPQLPNPAPAPMPALETAATGVPEASAVVPEPEAELPVQPVMTGEEKKEDGTVNGWVSLGAGSPGTLLGDLAVTWAGLSLPDFDLRFSYDAADGFGGEYTGEGFFDRAISLGAQAASERWNAEISLSERTDGLQGMNADLYSLTSRDIRWNAAAAVPVSISADLTASFALGGAVYTSFADRPGSAVSSASAGTVSVGEPLVDTGGYRIEPGLSLTWVRGRGTFVFDGSYGYETLVGTGDAESGELNMGNLALSASGTFGRLSLGARAGTFLDSVSGTAFPFSLTAEWEDTGGVLRVFTASGGIDAYRSGVETLASADPFVSRNYLSRSAADWFGSVALNLAGPTLSGAETGLESRAQWRSTAFGFGILDEGIIAEPADGESAGLVPVSERERQSLATGLELSASAEGARLAAGWKAEWLDSDSPDAAHRLSSSLVLFDPNPLRRWETSAKLDVPLGESTVGVELPFLSLSASLRPASAFTVTLSFDDIIPLAAGEPRMRNAVYADRSGVLALSGRIDF